MTTIDLAESDVRALNQQLHDANAPAQGGRYVELAVVESNPRVFYAATATGGLWKTVNHGISFTSVFDNQQDFAIGAVAVAQSRPDVVYLGTGEANNSRSANSKAYSRR